MFAGAWIRQHESPAHTAKTAVSFLLALKGCSLHVLFTLAESFLVTEQLHRDLYLFSSLHLLLPNVCGLIYVDLRNVIISCPAEEVSLSLCLFFLEGRPLNLWFANFPFKHGTLFIKQTLTSKPGSVHEADESGVGLI